MIPSENTDMMNMPQEVVYATRTYFMDVENKRIVGFVSGLKAMEQAIYKILLTPRFRHIIYSWNYGTEHFELMDRLIEYNYSLLREYITDALTVDDRIMRVYDFEFSKSGRGLLVKFKVDTTEGELSFEWGNGYVRGYDV